MLALNRQSISRGEKAGLWAWIIPICLTITLVCGCEDDTMSPDPPIAQIEASPGSGPAPLTVHLEDVSKGEITSRQWTFLHTGQNASCRSLSITYRIPDLYGVNLTVDGPGGSDSKTIYINVTRPERRVSLSDLSASVDAQNRLVWLSVDAAFTGLAGQPRVLGLYWLKSCGGSFCFQNCKCDCNAPDRCLGQLIVLTPNSDNASFNNAKIGFPYSCFPDRSRGARYYGYARVYDRIDINAVTDPNDPALGTLGPPGTVVYIEWQSGTDVNISY